MSFDAAVDPGNLAADLPVAPSLIPAAPDFPVVDALDAALDSLLMIPDCEGVGSTLLRAFAGACA